jgi:membrane protease YdiL (CAAX protease family)
MPHAVHQAGAGSSRGPAARGQAIAAAEAALAAAVVIGHNVFRAVPNEVPVLLLAALVSLVVRRQSPRSIGFLRPSSWRRTLLLAAATAVALQLVSTYVTEPLMIRFAQRPADLSEFRPLVGNVKLALGVLPLIWAFAAFGEEIVYRGYILTRLADAGGASPRAWAYSVFGSAVLFAIGHYYQGPTGMIDSGVTGLVLGTLYVRSGHNLWPAILAHGLTDTIALVIIVTGLVRI